MPIVIDEAYSLCFFGQSCQLELTSDSYTIPISNLYIVPRNTTDYDFGSDSQRFRLTYTNCSNYAGASLSAHIALLNSAINNSSPLNELNNKITTTAFGGLEVEQLNPIFNIKSLYDQVNTNQVTTNISGGGSVTCSDALFNITNGATTNDYVVMNSVRSVNYQAGTASMIRWTAIYDTAVDNTTQLSGLSTQGNGLFIGYNNLSFGVMRREGGKGHITKLTISGNESGSVNATVTLNGVAFTVPLTSGATAFNAYEIGKYASYTGWDVEYYGGADIYFHSQEVGVLAGAFTYSATGTSGSFATQNAGVANTETWVYQDAFNGDTLDGTGESGMTIDPTKGNVYQIKYQWLGFGKIEFFCEDEATGYWNNFHTIHYANQNTEVTLRNPNMKSHCCMTNNGGGATTMKIGSIAGFLEGLNNLTQNIYSSSNEKTISSATETNIIVVKSKLAHNGVLNRSEVEFHQLTVATDGTKNVTIRVYLNGTLGDGSTSDYPNFSTVDTYSTCLVDTNSISHTGGRQILSFVLSKADSIAVDLSHIVIEEDEWLTVTAESSASSDITVGVEWHELL